jgi:hypothetical protein
MTNVPYKLNMVVEPLCRSGCHLSRNVTWDARQDLSSSEQQSSSTDTSLIGDDVSVRSSSRSTRASSVKVNTINASGNSKISIHPKM